ncbi:GNAT family N-acetyltransferase [Demequina aurantiaca]|uniref:GNAT family N-acetyltransferase n=1 Tax=Demequina aurantiaca TaxID=676200 RepID=UPI003D3558C2
MDHPDGKIPATTPPDGYARLQLTPDRWDDVVDVDEWAFLNPWLPEERLAFKEAFVWDRGNAIAIADERHGAPGDLVAVRCSYPFEMVVPGGRRVPTAGLSWVGVHPGHRRRGLLSAMMREHFEHSLARGELLSVLTASEPKIYQRFGYGLGTRQLRAKFARGAGLRDVAGAQELTVRLERLNRDRHADLMATLQRQVDRPGSIVREGAEITVELFSEGVNQRPEKEPLRVIIVSNPDGVPQAFAVFRRVPSSQHGSSSGEVLVFNFVTTTAASARRLWSVLFDLDLTSEITVTALPLDDPLAWLATDPRAPQAIVEDDLWVRILDVPRALAARTYDAPVDVVIGVRDAVIAQNDGLWHVSTQGTDDDGRHVALVTRAPGASVADLSMDIQDLSAAYLGGVSVESLTDAGLVDESSPGSVRQLSDAMRSTRAPASLFHF